MAQPCPASHIEDHLSPVDRECLDDCPAVALAHARPAIVRAGMLAVGRLAGHRSGRPMCSHPGFGRLAHDLHPVSQWSTLP